MRTKPLLLALIIIMACAQMLPAQQITVFNNANSGLPDNTVRAVAKGADGALWIGTDWGLARFHNGEWSAFDDSNAGLPDNSIRSIAIDNIGRIWVGSFVGGIAILESDTVTIIYNEMNSPLPGNHVRAITFDSAGVWVGTTGGLSYLRDTVWEVYTTSNSILRSNNIASIHIDAVQRIWIGTINGGLVSILDTTWTLYRNDNSGLADNTSLDLAHNSENILWIAAPAAGVTAFNGSQWATFNTTNSGSPTNSYNGIVVLQDQLYLTSLENGLVIFRGGTTWENYDTSNSQIPQNELLCIEEGDSGCAWIGTLSSGLVKFCDKDSSLFIGQRASGSVRIFPVPAISHLNIQYYDGQPVHRVNVYAISGKSIFSLECPGAGVCSVDLNQLSCGIYLLEILRSDGRHDRLKFIKAGT